MASAKDNLTAENAKLREELRKLQAKSDVPIKLDHETHLESGNRRFKAQRSYRDKVKVSSKLAHEITSNMCDAVKGFVDGLSSPPGPPGEKNDWPYLACIYYNENGTCKDGFIHMKKGTDISLMHICIVCLKIFKW